MLLVSASAAAGRILPRQGKTGEVMGHRYPLVNINGKTYRLAPGARIYDRNNRTILQNRLPDNVKVLYKLDMNGEVIQLWLLTPREQAALRRAGE